jgi:methyltransferase (TIGR00027 family)
MARPMRWRHAPPSSGDRDAAFQFADSAIRHVSDTALWVASWRAQEGHRVDAAFNDPLASLLSGERGRAIARSIPRAALVEWGLIIRTLAIDRLINETLTSGIDTVLNLGAGLDTRPYRMKLPATLRWVELDFPTIVDLKNAQLADHQPTCTLERVGIDLRNRSARTRILARYGTTSDNVLIITEGVLPYFSVHDVATLACELHAMSAIRFWIQDFDNAGRRRLPPGWEAKLKAAPMLFDVKNWFEFFEQYGWRSSRVITSWEESQRIKRPCPRYFPLGLLLRALPNAVSRQILNLSGAVLMQSVAYTPGLTLSQRNNSATTWSFMGEHA